MKLAKEPTPVIVLAGKEAEAVRQQRYEKVLARIAQKVQDTPFSEEEILAELQAFREGK